MPHWYCLESMVTWSASDIGFLAVISGYWCWVAKSGNVWLHHTKFIIQQQLKLLSKVCIWLGLVVLLQFTANQVKCTSASSQQTSSDHHLPQPGCYRLHLLSVMNVDIQQSNNFHLLVQMSIQYKFWQVKLAVRNHFLAHGIRDIVNTAAPVSSAIVKSSSLILTSVSIGLEDRSSKLKRRNSSAWSQLFQWLASPSVLSVYY